MPQQIVIIGAVALGPKAACRFKRLEPDSQVIMIDQSNLISYGGCGIPYYISGDVADPGQLQSTSFNMLRDEAFFRDAKDIQVMTHTQVTSIDRQQQNVHIQNLSTGEDKFLAYDKLVLATGSRAKRLPLPGSELDGVFTVSNMDEAIAIKGKLTRGEVEKAVIIGAGAIGLEMAEALSDLWGVEVCVIEVRDQILPNKISAQLARMAQHHMEQNNISFLLSEKVKRIEGDRKVEQVVTNNRSIPTDLVIMAVGVDPNSDLAESAGLDLSPSGAIIVNKMMQTSDPNIYAGGDCVEIPNLITGKADYFPLGSMANRQGRIIGTNLAGGNDTFEGAVGSFVIKLFDISLAGCGLSMDEALSHGFDCINAFIVQFDKAHFYPDKDLISLELVAEKESGLVLGIQGMGNKGEGTVGRINSIATILKYHPTVKDISNLELAYSPPFSSAMDILNALGNTAENILQQKNRTINVDQFADEWKNRETNDTLFLDCRGLGNAKPFVEKYPIHWKSIPQDELRGRLNEVPGDKKILLICNTGVRSYEAQITLDQLGIKDTLNLQGGMAAVKKWGFDIL